MARTLTHGEYYEEIAKRTNSSPQSVKNAWEIIIDFWLEELKLYGEITIPLFANIKNSKRGDKYKAMPKTAEELAIDDSELSKLVYIPEYRQLVVKPTDGFKEQLNGKSITRHERNRQKAVIRKQTLVEQNLEIQREREQRAKERFEKAIRAKEEKERKRREDSRKSKKQLEKEKDWIDYGNEEDE